MICCDRNFVDCYTLARCEIKCLMNKKDFTVIQNVHEYE